ncbi:MAG: hypothetical protein HQ559_15785 [Lentisphaerae bacterium]|nr:hypothetical protein [Lentisphaerota bacterium]
MADIRFSCSGCGQTLEAPPEMAGDLVVCPACEAEIRVPAAENVDQPAAGVASGDAGGACPECGVGMDPDAVLCVQCGYHLKLGKKISTDLS